MDDKTRCPVCSNADGGSCREFTGGFECSICGIFKTHRVSINDWGLNRLQSAVLSHRIRRKSDNISSSENDLFKVTPVLLDSLRSNGRLPGKAEQAANIVRFIGDEVSHSGEAVGQFPQNFHAIIGALNREAAIRLTKELVERKKLIADPLGTAVGLDPATGRPIRSFTNIDLSLDGWEQYEAEKRGGFAGNYGFLAMQFDEPDLETFVREVVKPAVKKVGYDLVDMNDVGRAGIIDNIMRLEISRAAFVIADLTHDNSGAYWEAGYAEGLGKPVLYICEVAKFEEESTHFDTNHCTTIPWCRHDPDDFREKLIATLRRSLDLPS